MRGGPGDLDTAAGHGITYRFGERAETRAQLRWMRQWNTTGHRLAFHGMDLPGSSAAPGPAVRTCLHRLPARDGDADLAAAADLGPPPLAARRWAELPRHDRTRLTAAFTDLVRRAADHGDEIALRCARSLCALADLACGVNRRDEFMADSVRWILDREDRIVLSAHNGHLQRSPRAGQATLGGLLAEELGEEVVVIGTTYGSGPELRITPHSHRPYDWDVAVRRRRLEPTDVEAVLDASGLPVSLVDLRGAPADLLAPARGWRAQGGRVPLDDIPAAFDALIHVQRADLAHGVVDALRADVATARGDR